MKPVPMPFRQRWHEFRTVHLPRLAFLMVFVATLVIWKLFVAPSAKVAHQVEVVGVNAANVTTRASDAGR